MLSRVDVITSQGSLLGLELADDESSIYVQEITGLDPVKATLVSSSFANTDGDDFQSSRRESRNITMKLGLDPDYSVETVADLRNKVYAFFMPKSVVTLRFYVSELLYVDILGTIESCDVPLFVQEPVANISLMCFDPDFRDPNLVTINGMSTSDLTDTVVTYPGTVETGFLFTLRPDRALSDFTIYHQPPDGTLRTLYFTYPLVAGDVLNISTVVKSKYATLTRGGSSTSQLYSVTPQSNWLALESGDNGIRVYASGAPMPYSLQYITKYGGI